MGVKDLQAEADKDLRNQRLQVYEDLWKLLPVLARYDRPKPLNTGTLQELTAAMRDWYFDKGGLFLTEESRPAYFKLKDAIAEALESLKDQPEKELDEPQVRSLVESASDLRTRLANELGTRKTTFDNVAKADPSNVQEVAATQLELINNYYSTILDQARKSFNWAIIAAGVGLLFFVSAVGFLLVTQKSDLSAISVISGALIEVISGINFYLYGKALSQLDLFHGRLERTQRFLLANSVCEKLKGETQQLARAELVRVISGPLAFAPTGDAGTTPPVGQSASPPTA